MKKLPSTMREHTGKQPVANLPLSQKYQRKMLVLFGLLSLLFLSSCGGVKYEELVLFQQVENQQEQIQQFPSLRVQADDILNIEVASRNPETVAAFRQFGYTSASQGEEALSVVKGYRIDELGLIYLPFIGAVPVINMRIIDIRTVIQNRLREYIPDASVQIRFANFRITVLGEVNRPGVYSIPNERVNILEAVGLAGDLTPFAKRDRVLLIRERGGSREYIRINIQDQMLFNSQYFYLSPNDLVYVEPIKQKRYSTGTTWLQKNGQLFFPLVQILTFVLARVL